MADLNDQEREARLEEAVRRMIAVTELPGTRSDLSAETERAKSFAQAALAAREEPPFYGVSLRPWHIYGSAHNRAVKLFADGWLYEDEMPKPCYPTREDTERPDALKRLREEAEGAHELLAHFRVDRRRLQAALKQVVAIGTTKYEGHDILKGVGELTRRAERMIWVADEAVRDTEQEPK